MGNLRERDHLVDQGLDGRIIIKWIFKKWNGRVWTGLIWLSSDEAWEPNQVLLFPNSKLKRLLIFPCFYFVYSPTFVQVSDARDVVGIFGERRKHSNVLFGQTQGFCNDAAGGVYGCHRFVKGSFRYSIYRCVLVTQNCMSCSPIPLSYPNMVPRAGSEREVISRSVMCSN